MVQYSRTRFDASFAALSDATRRGVLEQLGRADASITDLAEKFHMTLTGMKKHVGVLEQAGLVITEKVGRVRTCRLGLSRLEEEAAWIERYRQLWDARFDELDKVVEELKRILLSPSHRSVAVPHPALALGVTPPAQRVVAGRATAVDGRRIRFQRTRPVWLRRDSVRCQSQPT